MSSFPEPNDILLRHEGPLNPLLARSKRWILLRPHNWWGIWPVKLFPLRRRILIFWVLINSGICPDNLLFLRSSMLTFTSNVSGISFEKLLSCRSNTTNDIEFIISPDNIFAERSSSQRCDILTSDIGISPYNELFESTSACKFQNSPIQLGIKPVRLLFEMSSIGKNFKLCKPCLIFSINKLLSTDKIFITVKLTGSGKTLSNIFP